MIAITVILCRREGSGESTEVRESTMVVRFRGYPNKGGGLYCTATQQNNRAISPLKLPSLSADLC